MKKIDKTTISYFYNEKGDYTITLNENPIAFTFKEDDAIRLVRLYKSLTMRISVLLLMNPQNPLSTNPE